MKAKGLVLTMLLLFGASALEVKGQGSKWFIKGLTATDPNKQIEFLTKSIEKEGESAITFHRRGLAYYELQKYIFAKDDYSRAIEIDSNYIDAILDRSVVYVNLGQYDSAIADNIKIIEIDSSNAKAYYNLSNLYILLKQYDEAIIYFLKMLKIKDLYNNKLLSVVYSTLAQCYIVRNYDINQVLIYLSKAIELDPYNKDAYYNRGAALSRINKNEEAIKDFDKVIEIDPKYKKAHYSRGLTKLQNNDITGAITDFNKAIKFNPSDTNAYYYRGYAKYSRNDYAGAIIDFSKAIELNKLDANYYSFRASCYFFTNQFDLAIGDHTTSIQLDPSIEDNYINLGIIYYSRGEYKKANGAILMGLEQLPQSIKLLDALATFYMDEGFYDNAIKYFNKCLAIENTNVNSIIGLSLAYYYKSDKANAKHYLDEAKKLEPRLAKGMDGIAEIEKDSKYSYSDKNKETLGMMFIEFK